MANQKKTGVALEGLLSESVETSSDAEVSSEASASTATPPGESQGSEETPPAEVAYRVAPGRSIVCRLGIVSEGKPFEARFCADGEAGEAALAELLKSGAVLEVDR